MKKKSKIIMLQTITKSNIVKNKGVLNYGTTAIYPDERVGYLTQHLYFISDEKIKEGDCVYHNSGYVSKCVGFNLDAIKLKDAQRWKKDCKKIIATTDSNLTVDLGHICLDNLPHPPQEFVKKYCDENGIKEVELEYEEYSGLSQDNEQLILERLKINSENEINIYGIKDKYTKKEVESKLQKFRLYSLKFGLEANISNNWIKDNL